MNDKIDLTGQVAIVTGGGRGLGRAFAIALADAGAAVAVTARSADQLDETVKRIEDAGGRAIAVTADVTDQSAVEHVVAETECQLGPADLLVNNAGRFQVGHEMWQVDPEQWWQEIEVNVRGPFLYARAVLPSMVARNRGRIINVSSVAGLWPSPYVSAYGISKTALTRFNEDLAIETQAYNISVFAIHPGTVRTPMNTFWLDFDITSLPEHVTLSLKGFRELFRQGRDDPIEPAIALVLALASGKADALSGCFISIHDDLNEMISRAEEIQREGLQKLRLRTAD